MFATTQGNDPSSVDRGLLAHELAHATAVEDRNTIFRDAAPPNVTGLAIPVSPDALTGIHEWEPRFAAPFKAASTNRFYVGAASVTLQQICTFDSAGAPQVYMYFATARESKQRWAVGPDSLMAFAKAHGGALVAAPGNTDTPTVRADAEIDVTELPPAPDAYRGDAPFFGPTIAYVVGKLPLYDVPGHSFVLDNFYVMKPYLRRLANGSHGVLFYVAHNMHSLMRPEYIVPPHALPVFRNQVRHFAGIAFISYPITPGAVPATFKVQSARFVQGVVAADAERAHEGAAAWKSAVKNPEFWASVISAYGSRAQALPRVRPPDLNVIQGGRSSLTQTTTTASASPVVQSTTPAIRGATALATETAPVVAPAASPAPTIATATKPVAVPGWNSNPIAPVRRVPPMSSTGHVASQVGAQIMGAAFASPATQLQQQQKPPRPVTLHLPASKAPHVYRYRSLIASRSLYHSVAYQRGKPNQRSEWKRLMRPLTAGSLTGFMEPETYRRGEELLREFGYSLNEADLEDKVLVPNWSRTQKPRLDTDVDHVIELQVLGPDWTRVPWANTFGNFEVLDEAANSTSGTLIRQAIQRERIEQASYYNDPHWRTTHDLVFDRVEADGGGPSANTRWSDYEVSNGEHIDALEALLLGHRR